MSETKADGATRPGGEEDLSAVADPARLAALRATGLLEETEVATFVRVTRLAARALRAAVAQVNLVTEAAQVPIAAFAPGVPDPDSWEVPVALSSSFCKHVVALDAPLVVSDAREHPLVRDSRATTEAGIIAYAAAPVRAPGGEPIGSVCVVDFKPRAWTADELDALQACADIATDAVRARAAATDALARTLESIELRAAGERAAIEELERRNLELQDQGLELELLNQSLQENAVELEAQAAELQSATADLEERTTVAENAVDALTRSEARARALAELLPVHVWTALPDGRLDYVSDRTAAYFGTTTARLLGEGWGDFAHPEDLAETLVRWTHAVTTGEPYEVEFRLRGAGDDGWRWHLGRAIAQRNDSGSIVAWIGSNTDIDATRAAVAAAESARAAAEASEKRFEGLSAASPVGIFYADLGGHVTYANPRLLGIWEVGADEIRGRGWTSRVHPDDVDALVADWTAALGAGHEFEREYRLQMPDGRVRVVHGRSAVVRDAVGRAVGTVGTIDDVTERRAAEGALRIAEARLRDLFEQAPVAVAVMTGPEHVYTVASPRYREMVGGRELLGLSFAEAFRELADEPFLDIIHRVYETGEPFSADERRVMLAPRGGGDALEEHFFNVGYQPLREADGRIYGVASVAVEVTPQVHARRAVDEARAAAEAARATAEAANAAKSQFLSTMSHELRTPLNAIAGYAELLSLGIRGPVTEAQQEDFGRIKRANQHLMGLITDILNFARLDAGQVEFRLVTVPLGPLVADLESLVAPQLAARGLTYDHDGCAPDTPERPHIVRADPERLRQVLLNLLTNAMKFTAPGGRVALSCENDHAAGVVHVRVTDTGRGIPPDQLERIFEPFVQIDRHSTHESQQGVGLGLAISRDLARRMGGDLVASSEPGSGSTFTLTLPEGDGR